MDVLTLLAYDVWATKQLLASVADLSDSQFSQELSGQLSSIRQQCVHLVSVSDRYRARIMGEPVPEVGADSFQSPAEITVYAGDVAERMAILIAELPEERMSEMLTHQTRRGPFVATVEETLQHVVNHGTYHRGQIAALLKIHGIAPVDTDLIIWQNLPS